MINELIRKRKSIVLFSDMPISRELIDELFEAAHWAPSSNNIQPWRFVYAVKGEPEYDRLFECLSEKNKEWVQHAPMLLLSVAQIVNEYNNRENIYAWHDTGMAYATLAFQALSLGLSIHPMGGYDREMAATRAQLPEGYVPVAMAAIGYKSDSENFPAHLIEKENRQRTRKPVSEIVFHGKFGQPFPET
jgi:nitroreductase